MPGRLTWDNAGERMYETGVEQGVLYVISAIGDYPKGVPWNGLSGVTESPSGAEPNPIWADNRKYLVLMSVEEFGATIEAFMYPDEFAECDGSAEVAPGIHIGQQTRKTFGFCYRTILGNDTEGESFGYKIHLFWGARVSPSEKAYGTVNDSPEATTFSWEVNTVPVPVPNHKPTASMVIDSTTIPSDKLKAIEDILYGSESNEARLPFPEEIIQMMTANG